MHRAIYQRHKHLPNDDAELIEAVREAGIIEEELTLSSAQIRRGRGQPIVSQADQKDDKKNRKDRKLKGNADREKCKDKNQGIEATKKPEKKEIRPLNTPFDFNALKKVWDTPGAALQGISQASIDKYKSAGKDCIGCGYVGHLTIHCYRMLNADGEALLPAPTRTEGMEDKVKINAVKRKSSDATSAETQEPDAKKLWAAAVQTKRNQWYEEETDSAGESEEDFQNGRG